MLLSQDIDVDVSNGLKTTALVYEGLLPFPMSRRRVGERQDEPQALSPLDSAPRDDESASATPRSSKEPLATSRTLAPNSA
jgi:hypothetical protein